MTPKRVTTATFHPKLAEGSNESRQHIVDTGGETIVSGEEAQRKVSSQSTSSLTSSSSLDDSSSSISSAARSSTSSLTSLSDSEEGKLSREKVETAPAASRSKKEGDNKDVLPESVLEEQKIPRPTSEEEHSSSRIAPKDNGDVISTEIAYNLDARRQHTSSTVSNPDLNTRVNSDPAALLVNRTPPSGEEEPRRADLPTASRTQVSPAVTADEYVGSRVGVNNASRSRRRSSSSSSKGESGSSTASPSVAALRPGVIRPFPVKKTVSQSSATAAVGAQVTAKTASAGSIVSPLPSVVQQHSAGKAVASVAAGRQQQQHQEPRRQQLASHRQQVVDEEEESRGRRQQEQRGEEERPKNRPQHEQQQQQQQEQQQDEDEEELEDRRRQQERLAQRQKNRQREREAAEAARRRENEEAARRQEAQCTFPTTNRSPQRQQRNTQRGGMGSVEGRGIPQVLHVDRAQPPTGGHGPGARDHAAGAQGTRGPGYQRHHSQQQQQQQQQQQIHVQVRQQQHQSSPHSRSDSAATTSGERTPKGGSFSIAMSGADGMGNGGHVPPTPLFERLVSEEVQELKAYARIIESQNRRLAELERIHDDLEARLELQTKERMELEERLELQERTWEAKCSDLEKERDQWKEDVLSERVKNERLLEQLNRKDQDIHRMLQRRFDAGHGHVHGHMHHNSRRIPSERNIRNQPHSESNKVNSTNSSPSAPNRSGGEHRAVQHRSPHEILAASGTVEAVRERNVTNSLLDFFGM